MMSREEIHNMMSDATMATGVTSWTLYGLLESVSEFCRLMLPITGVLSFVIYVILNRKNIIDFFKRKKQ